MRHVAHVNETGMPRRHVAHIKSYMLIGHVIHKRVIKSHI